MQDPNKEISIDEGIDTFTSDQINSSMLSFSSSTSVQCTSAYKVGAIDLKLNMSLCLIKKTITNLQKLYVTLISIMLLKEVTLKEFF